MPSATSLAKQLIGILHRDLDRLCVIDDYLHGIQADPYMPQEASVEYRLLAERCISNWTPLLVSTPGQALYVDSFRRGAKLAPAAQDKATPEMDHWQRSGMDARQIAVHRGALGYGHSFVVTLKTAKGTTSKGLSAMRTSALYEDAANDVAPYAALTITRLPRGEEKRGEATMWDDKREYKVLFDGLSGDPKVSVVAGKPHGARECPVTRFAAAVDLEGRTLGVVEPMIPLQDRINQTVFDLLLAQTYSSTEVRWATGMAPPLQRDAEGALILDDNGNPKSIPMNHNASRFLFGEDPDTKFGSLPGSPLGGFIESIDMSIRHLSAIAQVPPHHLLGQIANLSAEALQAAETSLLRKIEEFRKAFGESWERVFRIAAELDGDTASAEDFSGEVIWRDMEQKSLAQAADALGKMKESLEIPAPGLWRRVPNVTQNEIDEWTQLREDEQSELKLANALTRATDFGSATPSTPAVAPDDAAPAA